jgi:hypothetical protein
MQPKLTKLSTLPRPELPDRADLVLMAGGICLVATALFVFAGPGLKELRQAKLEEAVRGNAATLQLAAESYAAAHLGRYPADARELVPWLPDDAPPLNPLTGEAVGFTAAPGDLTYRLSTGGRDYVIQGWGTADAATPLVTLVGRRSPAP